MRLRMLPGRSDGPAVLMRRSSSPGCSTRQQVSVSSLGCASVQAGHAHEGCGSPGYSAGALGSASASAFLQHLKRPATPAPLAPARGPAQQGLEGGPRPRARARGWAWTSATALSWTTTMEPSGWSRGPDAPPFRCASHWARPRRVNSKTRRHLRRAASDATRTAWPAWYLRTG